MTDDRATAATRMAHRVVESEAGGGGHEGTRGAETSPPMTVTDAPRGSEGESRRDSVSTLGEGTT